MKWSTSFLSAPSRRLGSCCVAAGIRHENVHSALGDARATAQLLAHYLRSCQYQPPWSEELATSRAIGWSQWTGALPDVVLVTRASAALARSDGGWLVEDLTAALAEFEAVALALEAASITASVRVR